jgi:hypothetical protein
VAISFVPQVVLATVRTMALFVHRSPLYFFDPFIAKYYRQMAEEMNEMRERMYQLIPDDTVEEEGESSVPVIEENGETKMRMEFNVKDYLPEEVRVKLLADRVLQVGNITIITLNYLECNVKNHKSE